MWNIQKLQIKWELKEIKKINLIHIDLKKIQKKRTATKQRDTFFLYEIFFLFFCKISYIFKLKKYNISIYASKSITPSILKTVDNYQNF